MIEPTRRNKKDMPAIKEINGIPLPDGLELPGYWKKTLDRQLKDEPFKDLRPKPEKKEEDETIERVKKDKKSKKRSKHHRKSPRKNQEDVIVDYDN